MHIRVFEVLRCLTLMLASLLMGWRNSHLHKFQHGETEYYLREGEYDYGLNLNELNLTVGDVLLYEYDFGDDWQHDVLLESIHMKTEEENLPILLDGEKACPPEDCGSAWGFKGIFQDLYFQQYIAISENQQNFAQQ